jgi:hypothetical protein
MAEEKRIFTRVSFKMDAELIVGEQTHPVEEIRNLSIGGCLLQLKEVLEPGAECILIILMDQTNREVTVRVEGRIVRCTDHLAAIHFFRIDPDSLYHLQNIIRYNAADSDSVEQEIAKHPGIK